MPTEQLQHWFSKLTDHSPFFFAILDKQHNYRMVNARYCEIAGLSTEELVGMRAKQVIREAM